MMRRVSIPLIAGAFIGIFLTNTFSQEAMPTQTEEPVIVIREAQEYRRTNVAVEGYYLEGLFEVTVSIRAQGERPNIQGALLVGPGLGKIIPTLRKPLYATTEEEVPYETKHMRGIIKFGKKEEVKKPKGRLQRELITFTIPREKIKEGGRYELRIRVENEARRGSFKTYKFKLEDFDRIVLEES